ncbi:DUF3742 family protein [Burkholderia cepacia]|uniref:DUF3742 family protein n=1 Tax=Burkholderia cepacia TaxID=292 RepID=UPI0018C6EF6E
MKKAKAVTFAERAGRTVGRWLKPVVRMESTVWRNVAAAGAPHGLVLTLKWCVRLALLLGLMYLSIVPALIVLILVLLGSRGAGTADEEPWNPSFEVHDYMRTEEEALKPRWREGHSGWGLYSGGIRNSVCEAICAGCASAGIGVGSTRAVQVLNDRYRAVQHLTNADLPADARRAPLSGRGADGKRMPRRSEVKGLHHMPSRTWLSAARCIRVESLRRPQPLVLGCWTLNRCKLTLLLPRPHIPDVPIPQSRVRIPRVPESPRRFRTDHHATACRRL